MGSLKDGSERCNLPSRQMKQTDWVPTVALQVFKVNFCFYQYFLMESVSLLIQHPLTQHGDGVGGRFLDR